MSPYLYICIFFKSSFTFSVSLNNTKQVGIPIAVLASAAKKGHADVVETLLQAGADVNAKGEVRFA